MKILFEKWFAGLEWGAAPHSVVVCAFSEGQINKNLFQLQFHVISKEILK